MTSATIRRGRMLSSATAGIEFQGATMRYSEIERYGSQFRLLRLGDCDFEFDVTEVLFSGGEQRYLDVVRNALSEIFLGSTASKCRVAVHSPESRMFQSVYSPKLESDTGTAYLEYESSLLYDHVLSADVRHVIVADADAGSESGERTSTVHVSEIPASVASRFEHIGAGLKEIQFEVIPSTTAIIQVLERLAEKTGIMDSALAIGLHPTHTHYSIASGGKWMFHHARPETDDGDIVYFSLHALNLAELEAENVTVRYYGSKSSDDSKAKLSEVFGDRVAALNPMPIVDIESDRFEEGFRFEPFVLCLGAAL